MSAAFDYSAIQAKLSAFVASTGDTVYQSSKTVVDGFTDAQLDNASEAVKETTKRVTTQAVSFASLYKSSVQFLGGFVPLVEGGGERLTVDNQNDGELLGGLVVTLGPITNLSYARGTMTIRCGARRFTSQRAVTWLRDIFGTTDSSGNRTPLTALEPADITPVQICLAALFLRTGSMDELKALDCLILKTIVGPISDEDIASFKETLKSEAVESAVRKNLENRQKIIREVFVAVLSMVGADPVGLPAEVAAIRQAGLVSY